MRVGAVVLHLQYWPGVRATLDALAAQVPPPDETVVVDNASGDGSAAALREAFPGLHVVEAADNGGYAAGMNRGIAALHLDHLDAVLLLTHETLLHPGCLAALTARLDASPRTGVAGPLLRLRSDPARLFSSGGRLDRRTWHTAHLRDRPVAPVRRDWLDGAALLVRTEAWRAAGPLDERYFLYYEEVDLALAAQAAGWAVECVPDAVAEQEPGRMGGYLDLRNRLRLVRRHAPRPTAARVFARELARSFLGGDTRPRLAGWVAAATGRTGPPPDRYLPAPAAAPGAAPPPGAVA